MPEIEKKLAAGVQLGTIHKALIDVGFDLTFQTLKTCLYRYRKKHQAKREKQTASLSPSDETVSDDTVSSEGSRTPLSMQEIDRLMKPDPTEQAKKLARYERLAKEQRRSFK